MKIKYFMLLILIVLTIIPFNSTSATSLTCFVEWESPICNDNNVLNGYWWYDGWVPGLATMESQFLITPDLLAGKAVFYAPYVMEATAKYRGFSLDGYVDGVASMSCSEIGGSVWIKHLSEWEGPFLVVDCPRRNDIYGVVVFREEVIEVGFKTALRWGMVKYGGNQNGGRWSTLQWSTLVEVSKVPPKEIKEKPISYVDFLISHIQYCKDITCRKAYVVYQYPSTWRINGEWTTFKHNQPKETPKKIPDHEKEICPFLKGGGGFEIP